MSDGKLQALQAHDEYLKLFMRGMLCVLMCRKCVMKPIHIRVEPRFAGNRQAQKFRCVSDAFATAL